MSEAEPQLGRDASPTHGRRDVRTLPRAGAAVVSCVIAALLAAIACAAACKGDDADAGWNRCGDGGDVRRGAPPRGGKERCDDRQHGRALRADLHRLRGVPGNPDDGQGGSNEDGRRVVECLPRQGEGRARLVRRVPGRGGRSAGIAASARSGRAPRSVARRTAPRAPTRLRGRDDPRRVEVGSTAAPWPAPGPRSCRRRDRRGGRRRSRRRAGRAFRRGPSPAAPGRRGVPRG
jgi:hypothetical protein